MKVAMLVGMLMFNVIAGLYQSGWLGASEPSEAGQVKAYDDNFPPPPNWP